MTTEVMTVMTMGTEKLTRLLLASIKRKQVTFHDGIIKTKPTLK
jgi:hypothetical protein